MAARNKPYEQFGPYILFKKLEQDSLGDLWRAGRIEGGQLRATVALRRFTGGDRAALTASVESASRIVPQLTGTSFARDQVSGVADGTPFLAWDYAGGRSLRHIMDRGRGGKDVQPNPLPVDQAIVIAEKVALSLATTSELRDGSNGRLSHGALLPQLIWISDDGEIRVAGQQLAAGILGAIQHDPKIAAEIGRYMAPEFRTSGQAPKSADVFAMGAILFLLVTGHEPPDAMTASAFVSAVRAAKTLAGAPIPDDIRVVLDKSFNLDPSMRYASMADMKQAVSALAHGGKYSATTFNLAFYLSNLLKKEMEAETLEREKESKLNLAPYLEAPRPVTAPGIPIAAAASPERVAPSFGITPPEPAPKSKLPVAIAAVAVLAVLGAGAWYFMGGKGTTPSTTTAAAQLVAPAPAPVQKAPVIPEPIVAVTSTAAAATTSPDPDAQKKAFEDAVKAKMQAEMMKLQNDYLEQLKKQQSKNAPVAAAPAVSAPPQASAVEERPTLTAAQLDQQRRETARPEETTATVAPAPVQTQTTAPAVVPQPTAPAPAPVPAVREGDVVEMSALDVVPRPTRPITAMYPPIARQQKISATIVVTALINERGEVTDVKLLRGVARFGIDDAAVRAMRSARFTPPMKDGKRVKTWFPQTIEFRP
ncbi:MAG TPA: TonB family protein [Thermoanaerobaculia bacterium]|nr:TonB family protein [Thermoanaerobaculia bacterium]